MNGINPALLRRAAALYLCQLAVGGTLDDASGLIGLPGPQRAYVATSSVQRWARSRPDPREFENAVHALAEHLSHADGLLDYGRRRHALRDWCIGPGDWTRIREQLGPYHPHANRIQLGDRRRQTASMIVWTRVTQSEHVFAPHPIRDQQPPDVQAAWSHSDHTAWSRIQGTGTGTSKPIFARSCTHTPTSSLAGSTVASSRQSSSPVCRRSCWRA
jgi:hypothetical protein